MWEELGQEELEKALALQQRTQKAKNVILFIGDGMGVSTLTAARWRKQEIEELTQNEARFGFERFDHVGVSMTYNPDSKTPDSAPTATAFLAGVKGNYGTVGLRQTVGRGQCEQSKDEAVHTTSFLKQALNQDMSAGIVTTARLTHATPAAAYAYAADRNWESDTDTNDDGVDCIDIARQLIENETNHKFQVLIGGGRRAFLPVEEEDPEHEDITGDRSDGRNLIEEWLDIHNESNAHYVYNKADFDAIGEDVDYLLGLFEPSHMQYEALRNATQEPPLTDLVEKAIQILSKNPNGFVLEVESGRIDHAHHETRSTLAIEDTLEFARAVDRAVELTNIEDTLIIVTADHSHVFTMGGYPDYDTPILGLTDDTALDPADDDKPISTLMYSNGPGYYYHRYDYESLDLPEETPGPENFNHTLDQPRRNISLDEDMGANMYQRDSAVPLTSETHGGEEVLIYAQGPWAHLFHGLHEQSYIAHAIRYAACINTEQCTHDSVDSSASGLACTTYYTLLVLLAGYIVL